MTCRRRGRSLAEIGAVMSRPLVGMEEEASHLERLCIAARAAVDAALQPAPPLPTILSNDSGKRAISDRRLEGSAKVTSQRFGCVPQTECCSV